MDDRRKVAVAVVLVPWIVCSVAVGQTVQNPEQPEPSTTIWTLRDWTRVESWRFFEPPAGGGNNDYAYVANRLQASVTRRSPRYAFTGALQYVQFLNLPSDAVGPGPLGLGAVYFAHAGRSDSHQVYLRYLNLQLKNLRPGLNIQFGRMPYSSGAESVSSDPKIEAVKQQRVAARLVGEFEWSLYQRAYDGVRIDSTARRWNVTFVAFHPTQGGFEDAAGLMMTDVTVLGGSVAFKPDRRRHSVELQAFALRYNDTRNAAARPDNSGLDATHVDIGINTFGATLVMASPPDDGRQWDGLLWFAAQTGAWFEQSHRAASIVAEAGHQWGAARWRPWLRGGIVWASGDQAPSDNQHGTFFQLLPTVRRFSQSALYSQMNHTDLFAQTLLRPAAALAIRADWHRVGLASSRDHWYSGSGATQSRGTLFGFSTRPSNGASHLATIAEASGDYTLSRYWSINAYLGFIRGGDVVRLTFPDRNMTFAYVENILQF
jgi:hypothetical protein